MNTLKQFMKWVGQQLTFIAVVALAIVAIWFFISNKVNQKKQIELATNVTILETENRLAAEENKALDLEIDSIRGENDHLQIMLSDAETARDKNADDRDEVMEQRDALRDSLQKIGSNELFKRFNELFPFPGEKKYAINIKQIGEVIYITLDYELVKKENKLLNQDLMIADNQIAIGDSIKANLDKVVGNLLDKEDNNKDMILNLEQSKQLSDEEITRLTRKLWVRTVGMGILTGAVILLAL